jgi:hypothetical protein
MFRSLALWILLLASLGCSKKGELPETFSAAVSSEWLESEYELDEVWSVSHPEYESEILILLTSVPVEGLSPNYRVAFYERKGDVFEKIDKVFEFGGYERPGLGRHPELDIPAVVAGMKPIAGGTYFFVHDGEIASVQENENE